MSSAKSVGSVQLDVKIAQAFSFSSSQGRSAFSESGMATGTKAFRQTIADLQESKSTAKEMIIARALQPREGKAGVTSKLECFFVDDNNARSVLLMDAWGKFIVQAQRAIKAGCIYKITKFVVSNKGKSLPFGNNTIKITFTKDIRLEACNDVDFPVPKALPLEDVTGVLELQASRVTSLVLRVHIPGTKKETTVKRSGAKKEVTNSTMKASNKTIELAVWGSLATFMDNKTGDVRLDAINVIPAVGSASVKLGTMDCSSIQDATEEERRMLDEHMSPEEELQNLTTDRPIASKRQGEMVKRVPVSNCEFLAWVLNMVPSADSDETWEATYEIPSVIITSVTGNDYNEPGKLTYPGCVDCNFKALDEDGRCKKCGGKEYKDRYLLHCRFADPTGTVEGIMYHDAAVDFVPLEDLTLKPVVALVHVAPDVYNKDKHALEIYAFKPMFTDSGLLNVFRAPRSRFPGVSDKIIPATPQDVTVSSMSQTLVHGVVCTNIRFLVKTTEMATTDIQPQVDGMVCSQRAECLLSSAKISLRLAGSFDTVQALFALGKKKMVHLLCSATEDKADDVCRVFIPLKVYPIEDEDADTVFKGFKYEYVAANTHCGKEVDGIFATDKTPDAKRKAEEQHTFASPGWASPCRRLKVRRTEEAATAGVAD